jgi:uncharacterized membrane protein YgaE (UPF0421/DUF939 family)
VNVKEACLNLLKKLIRYNDSETDKLVTYYAVNNYFKDNSPGSWRDFILLYKTKPNLRAEIVIETTSDNDNKNDENNTNKSHHHKKNKLKKGKNNKKKHKTLQNQPQTEPQPTTITSKLKIKEETLNDTSSDITKPQTKLKTKFSDPHKTESWNYYHKRSELTFILIKKVVYCYFSNSSNR